MYILIMVKNKCWVRRNAVESTKLGFILNQKSKMRTYGSLRFGDFIY